MENNIKLAIEKIRKEYPDANKSEILVHLNRIGFSDDQMKDFTANYPEVFKEIKDIIITDSEICMNIPDIDEPLDLPEDIKNKLGSKGSNKK